MQNNTKHKHKKLSGTFTELVFNLSYSFRLSSKNTQIHNILYYDGWDLHTPLYSKLVLECKNQKNTIDNVK